MLFNGSIIILLITAFLRLILSKYLSASSRSFAVTRNDDVPPERWSVLRGLIIGSWGVEPNCDISDFKCLFK